MPHPDQEPVAQAVFTALADPTRRGILAELAARGPATATDLAARLPISRQAIAKHLDLLSDAGLVRGSPGSGDGSATGCRPDRWPWPSRSSPRWRATGTAT
ncbi:ArsR/SmtB family transcription factor [Actinomadura luteofluorescens]|uniref:ArsR/SmtB family transcription factor n=1 Tax=Actinomadura luteofluorescens TaxID=46163 RepID=UPI00363650BD